MDKQIHILCRTQSLLSLHWTQVTGVPEGLRPHPLAHLTLNELKPRLLSVPGVYILSS